MLNRGRCSSARSPRLPIPQQLRERAQRACSFDEPSPVSLRVRVPLADSEPASIKNETKNDENDRNTAPGTPRFPRTEMNAEKIEQHHHEAERKEKNSEAQEHH